MFSVRIPTLNPPYFPPSIFYTAFGVFWIFVIWVLWKIVQSLRGLDESLNGVNAILKEIAESLKNKAETSSTRRRLTQRRCEDQRICTRPASAPELAPRAPPE